MNSPSPPPNHVMPHGYAPVPAVDSSEGGTTVFVYGLLGLVLCQLLAPVAWVKGNTYMRTCAAMGLAPSGLGVAGRVLGIVATVLNVIGILVVVLSYLYFWTRATH